MCLVLPDVHSYRTMLFFFLYLFGLLVALIRGWEIRARVLSVSASFKGPTLCDVVLTRGVAVQDHTDAEPSFLV